MILHNGHVYQTGLIKYNVCPHQKNISFVSDLIPNLFSEDGWISVKRCPHFLPHWRGGLWLWGADPLHGAERSTQGRIFRLRLVGFNPCHVTGESCEGCAEWQIQWCNSLALTIGQPAQHSPPSDWGSSGAWFRCRWAPCNTCRQHWILSCLPSIPYLTRR